MESPSPAEWKYIRVLEQKIREGVPLTPVEFARSLGLAGTSSFKRYHTLKRLLNLYGWFSSPSRMRGEFPSLLSEITESGLEAFESYEEKVSDLQAQHRGERSKLAERISELEAEVQRLQAVLTYVVARFVGNDVSRVKELEELIQSWHVSVGEDPEDQRTDSRAIEELFALAGLRGMVDPS